LQITIASIPIKFRY